MWEWCCVWVWLGFFNQKLKSLDEVNVLSCVEEFPQSNKPEPSEQSIASIVTYCGGRSTTNSFGSCLYLRIQNQWDPQVLFLCNKCKTQITVSEQPWQSRVPLFHHSQAFHGPSATTSFCIWALLHHDLVRSPFRSSPSVPSYFRHYWDIFVLGGTIRKFLWRFTAFLFSSRCKWVWYTWHLWTWHMLQYCWKLHLHLSSWLHASQWRKQLHGYGLFLKLYISAFCWGFTRHKSELILWIWLYEI